MAPRRALPLALLSLALAVPVAFADPAGKTTLEETLTRGAGSFGSLTSSAGERYVVRTAPGVRAAKGRAAKRRSLAFFGQFTDPQIADEMSPARVEFVDPAGGATSSAWRPMELMGTQIFDQTVRNMNANSASRVAAGGRKAKLGFAITTGDLADNQQYNETRWFTTILAGGPVDPYSGKPVSATNPCNAKPEVISRLDADVAARRYTGVADYDDWRGAPGDRYLGFWDPDEAPSAYAGDDIYGNFPRYPGLLERAQQPFIAAGLRVPWYISRGNHDGLVQGNAAASTDLFRAIAVGCLKVFPNSEINPADFEGKDESFLFNKIGEPSFIAKLLAGGREVPPDPERRIIGKTEYKSLVGAKNGFRFVAGAENKASKGTASYYAYTPRKGLRFVSIDTVAEGGGSTGNIDDPQYRWIGAELRKAARKRQLVVVHGHHTLATMNNARSDELAGACEPADEPGCDADPRRSTPLHRGTKGSKTVRDLFLKYRNVIAYVAGHTHENEVNLFKKGRRAFWEIGTSAHIDWPQQSRQIEVMDNRDGTLSLFGTLLNHAAPAAAPAPGTPAAGMSDAQLASLGRVLSAYDPQADLGAAGAKTDRNVELVVRDPR